MLDYKIGNSYKISEENGYHCGILDNMNSKYLYFDTVDTYNINGHFLGNFHNMIISINNNKYIIEKLYNDENV